MIMILWLGLVDKCQVAGQLLLVLACTCSLASGGVYFIKPSQNSSCPPEQTCLTLSHLADNSTSLGILEDSNLTLLFLSGNHMINGKLSVRDLDIFSMSSFNVDTVSVTCTSQSRSFDISQTTTVSIRSLHIIECGQILVEHVSQFTLENTTFQGSNGTALVFNLANKAYIVNCFFINCRGSFHSHPNQTLGGVVIVLNSSIWVEDTTFENNSADFGAVVYGQESTITTYNSNFVCNKAFSQGGALSTYKCLVDVAVCTFIGNRAGDDGSVIFTNESSFYIADSFFSTNSADYSGGVILSEGGSFYITDSTFSDNTAPFSGVIYIREGFFHIADSSFNNTYHGGVIVADTSLFTVSSSSFTNNSADNGGVIYSFGSLFHVTDSTFKKKSATLGGAIHSDGSSFFIVNCTFRNNRASTQGGVFAATSGSSFHVANSSFSSNSIDIRVNMTNNNSSAFGAITVAIGYCTCFSNILSFDHSSLNLSGNTSFVNNAGSQVYAAVSNITFSGFTRFENCGNMSLGGGAINSILSHVHISGRTHMIGNLAMSGGAIFGRDSMFSVSDDTIIAKNKANVGGGVFLQQSSLEISGMHISCNIFDNNASVWGGGIYGFASTITVNQPSALHLMSNSAERGGGVYFEDNTKILIKKHYKEQLFIPEVITNFAGNRATFGGAIYIEDNTYYGACVTSTECFIQVHALYSRTTNHNCNLDTDVWQRNINTINVYFSDNKATRSGDNIFGGLLHGCITDLLSETGCYSNTVGIDNIVHGISNASPESISSLPVRVCFCNNWGQPDCHHRPLAIHVKKGETFKLSLIALDQANNPVEANITTLLSPSDGRFSEGQQTQTVQQHCTQLPFNLFSPSNFEILTPIAVDSPCRNLRLLTTSNIHINFLNCTCPVGFESSGDNVNCECICDSALYPYITRCNSTTSSLLREGNSWIMYVNDTDPYRYVIYPYCPYGYCHPADDNVSINLTIPNGADAQCANRHAGVLCGGCQPNFSLSLGSSRCLPCTIYWPAQLFGILLAGIIAGVLLVATLLVLNLTVATGLLNGFIFYANIVAASSSAFFPSSEPSFPTLFVAWLNLDIGFDVCFIGELDAYTKTWLQLAFPTYIITLVVLVIFISERSPRFTRLIGRRDPVATLATLILLSYSRLLSTTIVVLSFAILDYSDGPHVVWLLDGNIKYLKGKHIGLFTAAILIILLGIPYTFLLFLWQWCIQTPHWKIFGWIRNTRLNTFITTYHAPYSIRHRYWTGLLLLVRVVLYITAAVTTSSDLQVPLLVTNILVGGLFFLKGIIGSVYRDLPVDIIETLIYLNLLIFAASSLYHFNSDSTKQTAIAYISTTMILILLTGVVLIHGILFVKKKYCKTHAVEEDIAPIQLAGSGTSGHAKVTYSYVEFQSLPSESDKTDELQQKLIV